MQRSFPFQEIKVPQGGSATSIATLFSLMRFTISAERAPGDPCSPESRRGQGCVCHPLGGRPSSKFSQLKSSYSRLTLS